MVSLYSTLVLLHKICWNSGLSKPLLSRAGKQAPDGHTNVESSEDANRQCCPTTQHACFLFSLVMQLSDDLGQLLADGPSILLVLWGRRWCAWHKSLWVVVTEIGHTDQGRWESQGNDWDWRWIPGEEREE